MKTPPRIGLAPQTEFDFQYHLPAGVESFSVRYLARHFQTSHQHWINLVECGALKASDLRSPHASKSMLRIPRAELIRYLNANTK